MPENRLDILRDKINELKATVRHFVAGDSSDPYKATIIHEYAHCVSFSKSAHLDWNARIGKALSNGSLTRTDIAGVSEYSLVNNDELLAETTTLILTQGRTSVPTNILNLFDDWYNDHIGGF
jgi:hypothetical protein